MDGAKLPMGLKYRGKFLPHWPDRILGPRPGMKEMNLVCWGLFVAFLVVPFCVVRWAQIKTGSGSIRQLHSDFVYFYGVGHIMHEYPSVRLYDYSLQRKTFSDIYPARDGVYGPSPYPPFVALFFSLFARVPFDLAYLLWLGISLALYLIGITATVKEVFPRERLKISLIFCFALAFYPFFFGTLANGQLSSVAVCSVGIAIFQERHSKPFRSGLALDSDIQADSLTPSCSDAFPHSAVQDAFRIHYWHDDSDLGGHCIRGSTNLASIHPPIELFWTCRRTWRSLGPSTLEIYRP